MTPEPAQVASAESMTGASVVGGGLWHLTSKIVPMVFVAVVSVAAARFLGPERFGRQSFIAFAEISVIMLLTGGMPLALSRYAGSSLGGGRAEDVPPLASAAIRVTVVGATVGAAFLVAVAVVGAKPQGAWFLAAVAAFAGMVERIPSAVLIGVQRWRDASTPGLVTGALTTAAVLAVLAAGGGITGMFAVEAAVSVFLLVWIGLLARRALAALPERTPTAPPVREMLGYAAVSSVSVILTFVVWRRSEFLFLHHYAPEQEIGYYAIGFSAIAAIGLLPETLGGVLLPAVATLHGAKAAERINTGFARAVRLLTVASFPLTAGAFALGPGLVRLVYGNSFHRAGTVLMILVAPFPLLALVYASNALLSGIARLRPALITGLGATVVNLTADFILIPRHGAVGAAFANIAAQLTAAVPMVVLARRSAGSAPLGLGSLAGVALASLLGGIVARLCVVFAGAAAGVPLGALLGLLTFTGLVFALRALPQDDLRWLETTPAAPVARLVRRIEARVR